MLTSAPMAQVPVTKEALENCPLYANQGSVPASPHALLELRTASVSLWCPLNPKSPNWLCSFRIPLHPKTKNPCTKMHKRAQQPMKITDRTQTNGGIAHPANGVRQPPTHCAAAAPSRQRNDAHMPRNDIL